MINIFVTTEKWLHSRGLMVKSAANIDSTSAEAHRQAAQDGEFVCYLADQQSAGRGRAGRTWTSPVSGSALMATWSIVLNRPAQPLCSPLIGLGLFNAVRAAWPTLPWSLKAPNDLCLAGKKVAGLLPDVLSQGGNSRLLLGLGFNILASPGGELPATHLQAHLSAPLLEGDWNKFLAAWHKELTGLAIDQISLNEGQRQSLFSALKAHPYHAKLVEVSPQGNLVYPDRTEYWHSL